MEPSGVSVEVTKSCNNKDHCQSEAHTFDFIWSRRRSPPPLMAASFSFFQQVHPRANAAWPLSESHPLASACSALFPFGAVLRVTQSVRVSVGPLLCTQQRVCSCQSDRLQRCSVRGAKPLLDIRTESRQKFRRDGARLALSSVA